MAKRFAILERVEHDHSITQETDAPFLHRLQTGLLLALKEQGYLSELQYRHAQTCLDRQCRAWDGKRGEKGARP